MAQLIFQGLPLLNALVFQEQDAIAHKMKSDPVYQQSCHTKQ